MKLLILPLAATLLFTACWGGQWIDSPVRVEEIDIRTVQMARTLDSLKNVTEQNEILLRSIQAQAGMRNGDQMQNVLELVDQLERMLGSRGSSGTAGTPASVQLAYDEAFRQYQQGGYSVAAEGFFEVAMGSPSADIAADALYYMALCHQSLGETHRAIEELTAVYFRYPASERAPSSLARAAAIYGAHSAEAEMNRLESLILDSYPDSDEARLIGSRRRGE
jgi:TolA-binding protein